jgi:hypothetical protein
VSASESIEIVDSSLDFADLNDARIAHTLDFSGSTFTGKADPALVATRLEAQRLCLRSATVRATADISSARVQSVIDCTDAEFLAPRGIALAADAVSAGELVLERARLCGEFSVTLGRIDGRLDCGEAKFENLEGTETAVRADGINAAHVFLWGATAAGTVRFPAARVAGRFDCSGAELRGPAGAMLCDGMAAAEAALVGAQIIGGLSLSFARIEGAFVCDRATIKATEFAIFGDALYAGEISLEQLATEGEVSLLRARVSGRLLCSGAKFNGQTGAALRADGLSATDVFLDGVTARGEVRLPLGEIAGRVDLGGARLTSALHAAGAANEPSMAQRSPDAADDEPPTLSRRAFVADDLRAAELSFSEVECTGEVRLVRARFGGSVSFDGATLDGAGGEALTAPECFIGGSLFFRLRHPVRGSVDLRYATAGPLLDSIGSWQGEKNALQLRGFTYRSFEGDDRDALTRLAWLRASHPFAPETYSQLASVYRASGDDQSARRVAIARETDRRALGRMSAPGRVWNRFLGATVGYGYEPWKALVYLVVLATASAILFSLPVGRSAMVAKGGDITVRASVCTPRYQCFVPPVYAIDQLVPVLDLQQASSWTPSASRPFGMWFLALSWLLVVAGWLLTTAVVAGIGSIWRRD